MNKKEERVIGSYNYTHYDYKNTSIREEIKSLQKSIALQQQTLNKILNLLESLRAITNLRYIGGL